MKFHRSGDRRGFALLVALAALVIIGGLIVGAFFASTQEFRIGRNTVLQARAMTAAEYGLNSALTGEVWDEEWNNVTTAGKAYPSTGSVAEFKAGDGSTGTLQITNLGNGNFLVVSEGFSGSTLGAQGRKRLGGLVRLLKPDIKFLGAVTTTGGIKITGSTEVHGEDTGVPNWMDCPPGEASKPGIVAGLNSTVTIQCSSSPCVTGADPPVQKSADADNSDTYNIFGDLTYDDLVQLATKNIAGGQTFTKLGPKFGVDQNGNEFCLRTEASNWGDPEHMDLTHTSCRSYFPIIHVAGDITMTGGSGQGVLLVDGNLNASGGVHFTGPVIVKGKFSVTGNNNSGARFYGGVMAENVDLIDSKMAGNAVVNFSSCAISRAVNGSATPMFDPTRGWIEMY